MVLSADSKVDSLARMTEESCGLFVSYYVQCHTAAAVTFFVLEDIMSVLLTMDIARRISRLSLAIKIVSTTVALLSTAIKRILSHESYCNNNNGYVS